MVCASTLVRYRWFAIRPEEYGRKLTCSIKQGDVLRERNRNSAERRDSLVNISTGFQHVTQHQDHGKSETLGGAATCRQADDEAILVHAVEATAPWALCRGNDAMSRPCGQLEAIGDDIERIIIVSNQGRAAVAEPDCLTAPMGDRRRAIMAQDAMSKIVVASQRAGAIVMGHQFGHMPTKGRATFNRARRRLPPRSEIPAYSLIPTGGEASLPCIARFVFARGHETFEHAAEVTEKRFVWKGTARRSPRWSKLEVPGKHDLAHSLDKMRTRGRWIEPVGEILRFVGHQPVTELHDADSVRRYAVTAQHEFGDPEIAAADNSPDRETLLVWLEEPALLN